MRHTPVLLREVLDLLDPRPGEVFVDGTAGLGGHAAAIAAAMGAGTVVLNDVDPGNLAIAQAAVRDAAPRVRVVTVQGNFARLPDALGKLRSDTGEEGIRTNMFLTDLGFSSNQMEDPGRGLSFMRDGPLDMRLDLGLRTTAADLVNSSSERELSDLIDRYGEERHARAVARKIVQSRKAGPISTTGSLANIVRQAVPAGGRQGGGSGNAGRIDPATRTFQALRIAVNDELGVLEALLRRVEDECGVGEDGKTGGRKRSGWLAEGARIAMVAFHSLEDRLVKRSFSLLCRNGATPLTHGAVEASELERDQNPRSRSAKLRVVRIV